MNKALKKHLFLSRDLKDQKGTLAMLVSLEIKQVSLLSHISRYFRRLDYYAKPEYCINFFTLLFKGRSGTDGLLGVVGTEGDPVSVFLSLFYLVF